MRKHELRNALIFGLLFLVALAVADHFGTAKREQLGRDIPELQQPSDGATIEGGSDNG